MVGHLGAAPSVSPIRTARIAVFLRGGGRDKGGRWAGEPCPMKEMEPRGIAPRSTQCHCVVLLLDDGPEMERAPGLAPGKSGFAIRRLDDCGIARIESGEANGICTRTTAFTVPAAADYIMASIGSSGRRCPGMVSFTRGVHCWPLPRRKRCSREDLHLELPPSQDGVHGSYTSGAGTKWCVMPVPPRRCVFGRDVCSLLHQ